MLLKKKTVICKNCNAEVGRGAKVCHSCGAKIKKPFYKRWWFIVLAIIIFINTFSTDEKKFDWDEMELCNRLPEPKSSVGSVWTNNNETLHLDVKKTSKRDYKKYLEECKMMGYSVETENTGENYLAFDENGYKLALEFYNEEMEIELTAPIEMSKLIWPKSKIAALLPIPKSKVGKVYSDTADGCIIYVGDMPLDEFNKYIDECSNMGFNVDYDRQDKSYSAEDKYGNRLHIVYEGLNIISVDIREPFEDDSDTEAEEEIEDETDSDSDTSEEGNSKEIRADFKQAMDSYEAFMNEYCDFMKKYAESDGSDLALLSDYASYLDKYSAAMEDFENWEYEDLSTAETAYYIEVQGRVSKKLLEIAE